MSVTTERVASLVAPLVADLDAEIYDVEQAGGTLRVSLDRLGGIDLESIAEATRRISRALDESEVVTGSYTLEVSSPGLERRLRTPEHFQRAVGARVAVKTRSGADGDRRVNGVLDQVADGTVSITLDDGTTRKLALTEVERARTVFEWGQQSKPGQKSSTKNTSRRDTPGGPESQTHEQSEAS